MLKQWSIAYEDIAIDADESAKQKFTQVTNGARTVPQIIIDSVPIGGFMELMERHKNGELDGLM